MIEKVRNHLVITSAEADFTGATDFEYYVEQGNQFYQYTPEIRDAHMAVVHIPKEDAMSLVPGTCQQQFAYTDANGNPHVSEIKTITVERFLKEAGYGS